MNLKEKIAEYISSNGPERARTLAREIGVDKKKVNQVLYGNLDDFRDIGDHYWDVLEADEDEQSGDSQDVVEIQRETEDIDPQEEEALQKFDPDIDLDLQRAVIEARKDQNILVLSPPGTGKTYTLIQRLIHFLNTYSDTAQPSELLVLSFTRAAIKEIRDRITEAVEQGATRDLRYVRIATFDAYTTWVLNDGGYDLTRKKYDQRIALLSSLLADEKLVQHTDRVSQLKYLFVDEVQDLVAERADLVFELLKKTLSSGGTVSLLGDPLQAVNDYQIKNGGTSSAKFLEKVRSELRDRIYEVELERSHRFETQKMISLVKDARTLLQGIKEEKPRLVYERLRKRIPVIDNENFKKAIESGEIDAILFRKNVEVYQCGQWLNSLEVQFSINSGSGNSPWPSWIAIVLFGNHQSVISMAAFSNRINKAIDTGFEFEVEEIMRFLHKEQNLQKDAINVSQLAWKVIYRSPFPEKPPPGQLTLSTIHKAKGLEYKNVVIQDPVSLDINAGEVNVLYVGCTRAKRNVLLLSENEYSKGVKKCTKGGHHHYNLNGIKYLEINSEEDFDLDSAFLGETGLIRDADYCNYLALSSQSSGLCIKPKDDESLEAHSYALYLQKDKRSIFICDVNQGLNEDINALVWGNWRHHEEQYGALIEIEKPIRYQTIIHSSETHQVSEFFGEYGFFLFPWIEGFHKFTRREAP